MAAAVAAAMLLARGSAAAGGVGMMLPRYCWIMLRVRLARLPRPLARSAL
jgi:hypothetical protein